MVAWGSLLVPHNIAMSLQLPTTQWVVPNKYYFYDRTGNSLQHCPRFRSNCILSFSPASLHSPVILTLKAEECQLKPSLGYIGRLCLKKKNSFLRASGMVHWVRELAAILDNLSWSARTHTVERENQQIVSELHTWACASRCMHVFFPYTKHKNKCKQKMTKNGFKKIVLFLMQGNLLSSTSYLRAGC